MRIFERDAERIEIDVVDNVVVVRTYRGDLHVDERRDEVRSAIKAKWDADRLAKHYVGDGYTRIGDDTAGPSHHELLDAIATNPDDLDGYLVLADWLAERGDPWGEVIAVQHAIAMLPRFTPPSRRAELERQETLLLFCHAARLWGPLGETIVDEATQKYASDRLHSDEPRHWCVLPGSKGCAALIDTHLGNASGEHEYAQPLSKQLGKKVYALSFGGYGDPDKGLPYIEQYVNGRCQTIWMADSYSDEYPVDSSKFVKGPDGIPTDDPFAFAKAF